MNKNQESDFYYYLRNIPTVLPNLYDFDTLDNFKEEETHSKLQYMVNSLKLSYNELRKLLYSNDEFKDLCGEFIFGDYIWAM